jgi:hypothetical protein
MQIAEQTSIRLLQRAKLCSLFGKSAYISTGTRNFVVKISETDPITSSLRKIVERYGYQDALKVLEGEFKPHGGCFDGFLELAYLESTSRGLTRYKNLYLFVQDSAPYFENYRNDSDYKCLDLENKLLAGLNRRIDSSTIGRISLLIIVRNLRFQRNYAISSSALYAFEELIGRLRRSGFTEEYLKLNIYWLLKKQCGVGGEVVQQVLDIIHKLEFDISTLIEYNTVALRGELSENYWLENNLSSQFVDSQITDFQVDSTLSPWSLTDSRISGFHVKAVSVKSEITKSIVFTKNYGLGDIISLMPEKQHQIKVMLPTGINLPLILTNKFKQIDDRETYNATGYKRDIVVAQPGVFGIRKNSNFLQQFSEVGEIGESYLSIEKFFTRYILMTVSSANSNKREFIDAFTIKWFYKCIKNFGLNLILWQPSLQHVIDTVYDGSLMLTDFDFVIDPKDSSDLDKSCYLINKSLGFVGISGINFMLSRALNVPTFLISRSTVGTFYRYSDQVVQKENHFSSHYACQNLYSGLQRFVRVCWPHGNPSCSLPKSGDKMKIDAPVLF